MSKVQSGLIAVPDLKMGGVGATVFWRLTGHTDSLRLCDAWTAAGLDPDLLPSMPTPVAAVRSAINSQRGTRTLARPLTTRGDWVLKDESVVGNDTEYDTRLRVTLTGEGTLTVDPPDHPLSGKMLDDFYKALRELSGPATSSWLVDLVERCNGVALKDTGGVYFIPAPHLATWQNFARAVEAATAHVVLEIPTMSAQSAVRAVSAALTAEAEQVIATIGDELTNGDLGIRALASRQDRCHSVAVKIGEYEKLLDIELSNLRGQLDGIKAQVVAATLAAEQEDEEMAS
jgi:hypothetical protein